MAKMPKGNADSGEVRGEERKKDAEREGEVW